jgi:hypothetical protein
MIFLRIAFVLLTACWLCPGRLFAADAVTPPFAVNTPSSADVTITTKKGAVIQAKAYLDTNKVRADVTMNEMDMTVIIRKDQQKIYQLMPSQKMGMEMAYDPDKFKAYAEVTSAVGPGGKFDLVGPETLAGVACTKYKVTVVKTGQIFFLWLNAANKTPVKLLAANGSLVVLWNNYKAGPQNPALFEVPAGFQIMQVASAPGGGAPGDGGD